MQRIDWRGVFAAITTPFRDSGGVDDAALAQHVTWLMEEGCSGIVALGSLGEGATLTFSEKVRVLETCRAAIFEAPLVAGISALSTMECTALARAAQKAGCTGLMVLPPYVYRGDWRETRTHFDAVISATPLSCMLYNNPVAYGTDLTPEHVRELAAHRNVHAVKDSSGDVRRLTAYRALLGDRLALFAGLDDMAFEAAATGADGWIAGLVNALPRESVLLFELTRSGSLAEAQALYEWFLPLLRMDTVPKFVQLIKLVQAELGRGSENVRPPRLPLDGAERDEALRVIRERLQHQQASMSLNGES
jgi:1-pyrroline-4-hydroxy-2-carboxylate deaminase